MPRSQVELTDLEPGDDRDRSGERKSRERKRAPKPTSRADNELRGRLGDQLDRIAAALAERGDEELADIVREDAEVMARGLVSLTRPFRVLRAVLITVVSIIEPMIAFGRLFRLIAERWAVRRAQRAATGNESDSSNT